MSDKSQEQNRESMEFDGIPTEEERAVFAWMMVSSCPAPLGREARYLAPYGVHPTVGPGGGAGEKGPTRLNSLLREGEQDVACAAGLRNIDPGGCGRWLRVVRG